MADPRSEDNRVDDFAAELEKRWRDGERPAPQTVTHAESRSLPPTPLPERVGEYRIVREIGRGGMGVVYEAEQEALGRRVAIKVLPGRWLASEKVRSRFRRESQAAARLHHTNIVPVFGVGECDGECFYVMQLIEGHGLDRGLVPDASGPETGARTALWTSSPTDATENVPSTQTMSTNQLLPSTPRDLYRTVAQISVQVAEALAYAHSQGVLHRDIKPSNLLLDSRGSVWVTDFGVAKLVEEANLTQSGELVGTLRYMPPERFSGQSDGRGDVYSLGVTIYELLTRQPAFPDTTPQHLIHLITNVSLPRLKAVCPNIPRDLETIVLKAIARDPAERYSTASALAEDLRRFLDDRPILARRAGLGEQLWRWCRRNPALAVTTATAFMLMIAVTIISALAYFLTAEANRETANALKAETEQREHAEHASTLALEALNRTYDRFAPTRLVVTPSTSNEDGVELPPQPALPPEAVPLLEDLLQTYEKLARAGGEFPKLQSQAAEANFRIGDIRQRLGQFDEAKAAYRKAIELYQGLPVVASVQAVPIKLARIYNELGKILRALRQLDEAAQMHESAIQTLKDAPERLIRRPEGRYELARSYYALASRDMLTTPGPGPKGPREGMGPGRRRPPPKDDHEGQPPDRVEDAAGSEAIALLEQLIREYPNVPEYRHLLACCLRDMYPGDRLRHKEGPPSVPNEDRAVEILRQLVKEFPKVPDYQFDLCETLGRFGPSGMGGPGKKRQRLMEAVSLSEKLMSQYPNVPDYTAAHARYLDLLGIMACQEGNFTEAEKLHRQAMTLQHRLVKQYPDVVAYRFWLTLMECSVGRVLCERGELKDSRTHLLAAIDRAENLIKNDPRLVGLRPFLGRAYQDVARVYSRTGEKDLEAEARKKATEMRPAFEGREKKK